MAELPLPDGVRVLQTLGPHAGNVGKLAWSHDGTLLAVPVRTGEIVVWDATTGEQRKVLTGHADWPYAAAFDASGRFLVTVGKDKELFVWELETGAPTTGLMGSECTDIALAPRGRRFATAHDDGRVRLWRSWDPLELVTELETGSRTATCVAFDATGSLLAAGSLDQRCDVWEAASGAHLVTVAGHIEGSLDLAFLPDGSLVTSGYDKTLALWDLPTGRLQGTLEGHTAPVDAVSIAPGGEVFASGGRDGAICLWGWPASELILTLPGRPTQLWQPGVAFHPSAPRLTRHRTGVTENDTIQILELDLDALLGRTPQASVKYASAKVVLVGESGVGKTGLSWRLAHGEFKDHSSTHGQQFWLLDSLGTTRGDGSLCEAVLWDLAGQPDYRLIHALFIDDADLALIVFDPSRDDDPLRGVGYWLRQLGIAATGHPDPSARAKEAILVAGRIDRGAPRLTEEELLAFCDESGIRAFVATSAATGEGLEPLVAAMREAIVWEDRPTTVTTETFKQIKDYVLMLKERALGERVILALDELRGELEDGVAGAFGDDELLSAVGHLSNHGYVTRLRTSEGETRILLTPDLLNNVASSIVLEARRNPKGLGSLEERKVLAGEYAFPELDGLSEADRDVLLDSAVAMFLDHNLCFREVDPLNSQVYLVFPELINLRKPTEDAVPVADGTAYTAAGSVSNLYASLVVLLGYTSTFTRTNQWRDHARYVVGSDMVCGFRVEAERDGEVDFVLQYGTDVGAPIRTLYQSLFESFLARRNLTVQRYEPVICPNGHQLNRAAVRDQVAKGKLHGFCTECGERVALTAGDKPIELSDAETTELLDERRVAEQRSRFEQALFRVNTYVGQERVRAPSCFVSYAWGVAEHEQWVATFANDLAKAGIAVVLDRWESRIGDSLPRFTDRVAGSDRVIVVGTPAYRRKYENGEPMRGFVAAAEGDLIGTRMIGTEESKRTVLPVLLEGEPATAFPPLLEGRVRADFRDPGAYYTQVLDVVFALCDVPPQHPLLHELKTMVSPDRAGS